MARIRTVKPEFFTNEEIGACSMAARVLAIGLLNHADAAGRLEDRPARIKALIFPFDPLEVDPLLEELARAGYLLRYVGEGKKCLQIVNFTKHQRPHPKEPASCLPEYVAVKKNGKPCKKIQESSSSVIHSLKETPSLPETPDPDPERERETEGEGFDQFYQQYPRHVAKEAARKAWGKLAPSEREKAVVDVVRRRESEWQGKDAEYLPHPATYLNQRRWTDEIPVPRAGPRLSPGRQALFETIERERTNGTVSSETNPAESLSHLESSGNGRSGAGGMG